MKCKVKHRQHGKCRQDATDSGRCLAHQRWLDRDMTPDPFYEEKIVRGLLQPADTYLSEAECETMVNGRYRGDGRRIDVYCAPEGPLGIRLT